MLIYTHIAITVRTKKPQLCQSESNLRQGETLCKGRMGEKHGVKLTLYTVANECYFAKCLTY